MATIFSRKPTLEGQRVWLRSVQEQDAESMYGLLEDPEVAILTGSVNSSAPQPPRWSVKALRRTYEEWSTAEDRLVLAVIDRSTQAMVGEVVLNDWDEVNRALRISGGGGVTRRGDW